MCEHCPSVGRCLVCGHLCGLDPIQMSVLPNRFGTGWYWEIRVNGAVTDHGCEVYYSDAAAAMRSARRFVSI